MQYAALAFFAASAAAGALGLAALGTGRRDYLYPAARTLAVILTAAALAATIHQGN